MNLRAAGRLAGMLMLASVVLAGAVLAVGAAGYFVFFTASVSRAWGIYPALVWAALALRVRGAERTAAS